MTVDFTWQRVGPHRCLVVFIVGRLSPFSRAAIEFDADQRDQVAGRNGKLVKVRMTYKVRGWWRFHGFEAGDHLARMSLGINGGRLTGSKSAEPSTLSCFPGLSR
ncbi:hypothetical protein HYDPIDRAFT_112499 [Hydnomerulius pinastri MD-312]|uniref:Uncharacterized protein n=1 Tax=Hydnomerulius pinastri MD-312 TaxID=994086 RepID=A0A0C9VZU8_9AGAM|nr:hypothetical protein HYDPIDRAFT_112499 [Hydnomerulius pinastri MD-312]